MTAGRASGAGGSEARAPVSRAALIALGGVLILLLALAAAAAGSRRGRGSELTTLPPAVLDSAYTLAVVMLIVLAVLAVVVLLQLRPRPIEGRPRGLLAVLVGLALVTALAAFALSRADLSRLQQAGEGRQPFEPPEVQPLEGAERLASARGPRFRWDVALAAMSLAAAAGILVAVRARRAAPSEDEGVELAETVSLLFEDTLDDLRRERDPRRVVIAAYARLEHALAQHGVPRRPAEAPLEYLSRILLELEVEPEAVLDLTNLFEQAKFSRRRIDAAMKEEAIAALATVRDDLRAAA